MYLKVSLSTCVCALCLVTQLCPTVCDPTDCSPPGSSVHRDSPRKNTGVGCHALLQGIFPAQGANPGLEHHRQILYHLSYQGRICMKDTQILVLSTSSLKFSSQWYVQYIPIDHLPIRANIKATCTECPKQWFLIPDTQKKYLNVFI